MTETSVASTHPPLPPTTEDDLVNWLRLLRSYRVGISTFYRLMAEHGSAQEALAALPDVARAAGLERYEPFSESAARAELAAGRRAGARLIARGAAAYPKQLTDLEDAPPLLWCRGDVARLSRPMVAIVGARNASSLGMRMARRMARDLAERGWTIVSGLARGIDAAAHEATIETGTVAVLASGIDVPYPEQNLPLADKIIGAGALVSEARVGCRPQARHFPRRNRLISGLARAVIVIEAALRSGSLITAQMALAQGREVLAVPGHPFDARAGGCNALIRDGATLVRGAEDVIEAIGAAERPRTEAESARPFRRAGAEDAGESDQGPAPDGPAEADAAGGRDGIDTLHGQILARLGPSPVEVDQLVRDTGIPPARLASAITDMELAGRVERTAGGGLRRID